jgi:hypothetical protein
MKSKLLHKGLYLFLVLALLLTGCTAEKAPVYDAGQYLLSGAELDGKELSVSSLYPGGGYLLLSEDGSGRLILGSDACDVSWQKRQQEISLLINDLTATGKMEADSLTLLLEDLNLTLAFTAGDASAAIREAENPVANARQNRNQLLWGGSWSGRLWFEDPKGEWSDYQDQTLSLTAEVAMEPDGTGTLRLFSKYYSESVPMALVNFTLEQYKVHCISGYLMSYPIPEWGMEIELSTDRKVDVEDTVIMHPDIYEYGHYYNADPPVDRNEMVDVLRLTGSCHDLDGGFDYKIVLTR